MRSMPTLRTAPRLALVLLLTVPLAACGGADPVPAGERPLLAEADNPDVADSVEDPSAPRIVSVVVSDGERTGDTGVVTVGRNVPVRLVVISDRTDTVLVQGYGLQALATAEVPVQLDFIADQAGEFPVVLRESGLELTRLRVG